MNTEFFRRIIGIVMGMVAVAAASSCGGDEDPEPTYPADLLGTWTLTSVSSAYTYEGYTWIESGAPEVEWQLGVNPNSTMTWAEKNAANGYTVKERSFWEYANGTLREKGTGDRVQDWKVEFFNASGMTFTSQGNELTTFTDPTTGEQLTAPVAVVKTLYFSRYIPNVN